MASVVIVGAGQLGSRHLQALRSVETPLDIRVVEPRAEGVAVARERFEAMPAAAAHRIEFTSQMPKLDTVDVAIVATNADRRAEAVSELLAAARVRFLVLEKLLFVRRSDHAAIGELLARSGTRAWVNTSMRMMPTYRRIHERLRPGPLHYRVTGSNYGLVTNAIHYLDHLVHLSGCESFSLDTTGLDAAPIESKRAGFLELTGTLVARFADGSRCEVTSFARGAAPPVVEITTERERFIVRESEGKLWHSSESTQWKWQEEEAPIPRQSEMTAWLVRDLLAAGSCQLAPYESSVKTHFALLEPLRPWSARSEAGDYAFT